MKRFLPQYLWIIIVFGGSIASLKAQMIMDAQWTVLQNNGTTLELELGIRTNTANENLGNAQFVFEYDNTYVNFAGGGNGVSGIDYNWAGGFGSAPYDGGSTGVTTLAAGILDARLDFTSGTGVAISTTSSYTPVVDLFFAIAPSSSSQSMTITWAMNESTPGIFDDVTDDKSGTPAQFYEGTFNGINVNPLPVTLCDFKAWSSNSATKLSWATASEINNDYFTVERSPDGKNFSPVTKVKGCGNSETKKEYIAYDESPLPGLSYYRLRQTDFNGVSKTFNMVPVDNTNPVSSAIKINSATVASGLALLTYSVPNNEPLTITLVDMSGNIIHKEQIAAKRGMNTYMFSDALSWKPGIYYILINNNVQFASTKIFVP